VKSAEAIATLEEFVRCINAHDPKGIVSLCTTDHLFIDSLGSEMSGREFLQQAWAGYFSLFPDYRIDIDAAVSQNAVVLACGFASATHGTIEKVVADCSCMARRRKGWTDCRVAGLCRQQASLRVAVGTGLTNR